MLFWVATQVLRACKVSTTPPKSKIIVTKVAPHSFLQPVCCRHDTGWVATDFGICYNCCLVNIAVRWNHSTRVRDNIQKSKEQKNIQPTKGGHKMVTCQNYVSLFYCQITSCPSDGGIS